MSSANRLLPATLRRHGWRGRLVVTVQGVVIPGWHSKNCFALTSVNAKQAAELSSLTDLAVDVVYNGIDVSFFKPVQYVGGQPIVAWIGRARDLEQKRFDLFAAIAPILHRQGVRVWIADPEGPNALTSTLRERASPYVEFWDSVSRDRMPGFYGDVAASGGCVLSTARYEGLSFALIEAQSCGCPVIAARAVGVDEGVRQEYGGVLYAPDLGAAAIGDLVLKTISDTAGMIESRRKCLEFVLQNFEQSKIAGQYVEIYSRPASQLSIDESDDRRRHQRAGDLIHATRCSSWSFQEDLAAVRSAIAIDPRQLWSPTIWRVYCSALFKQLAFTTVKRLQKRSSRSE